MKQVFADLEGRSGFQESRMHHCFRMTYPLLGKCILSLLSNSITTSSMPVPMSLPFWG